MKMELPPRTLASEYITAEKALYMTEQTRQELFKKEKENVYMMIRRSAGEGEYCTTYRFNENCNREDILKLMDELISKGFEVEFKADNANGDKLIISWYSKEG